VSDKRISVRIWQPIPPPSPGNTWRIDFNDGRNHIVLDGPTEDSTQAKFCLDYGIARDLVIWLREAPPPPKRPPSVVNAPAIEGDTDATKFHRLVLRAFHPDLHGSKKQWSADQVVTVINQAAGLQSQCLGVD
jgi:hypothetical protein